MLTEESELNMGYAILGIPLSFAEGIVQVQSGIPMPGEIPPARRSFYAGRPVDHPESLSGVWEASHGQGGAVGIHLHLMTTVPLHGNSPIWTPQSWAHLEVSVSQRKGSEFASGDENYSVTRRMPPRSHFKMAAFAFTSCQTE
jgi:hypothetical protein